MSAGTRTVELCKHALDALIDPLRASDEFDGFSLAIPEAQTTTVDSVMGWSNRPAAILTCPGCDADIPQRRATIDIDCPNCYRTFKPNEFGDLDLRSLLCPRCETPMDHGIRHPNVFDVPEWATCPDCQYHWDLNHWYRRR